MNVLSLQDRSIQLDRLDAEQGNVKVKQIVFALKGAIETVYRGGIDAILSFDLGDNNTVTGKFIDAGQVYDYTISPTNELSYVESKSRGDTLTGARWDAPSTKPKQCKQGKPCGNSCIAKGIKCEAKLSPAASRQMFQVKQAIRTLPKASSAPRKSGKPRLNNLAVATGTVVITAALAGLAAAAYREHIRGKQSAEQEKAQQAGEKFEAERTKARQQRAAEEESYKQERQAQQAQHEEELKQARQNRAAQQEAQRKEAEAKQAEREKQRREAEERFKRAQEDYRHWESDGNTNQPDATSDKKSWWDVLGVTKDATKEEIKKAYRQKAREFHPDVSKDPNASEMMKEINSAFDLSGKRRGDRLDAAIDSTRVRRVILALKQTIETVYRGGIDALLSFDLADDNTISGKFVDAGQVYDYTISPTNQLSYVESKSRSDAYLIGYYMDSGLSRGIRRDAPSTKPKQCKQGKPCGNSCIAKGIKCQVKLSVKSASELKEIRDELRALRKEVKELKTQPSEPITPITQENAKKVATKFDVSKAVAIASIAGAALVATPIAGYFAFRAKYQLGFKQSANEAKKMAEEMKEQVPDDLKGGYKGAGGGEANQITFVVGGFAGQGDDNSLQYAQQFVPNKGSGLSDELTKQAEAAGESPDMFEDHHVVAINNREFEIRPAGKREKFEYDIPLTGQKITDGNVEQFRVMLDAAIKQGKNPVAVETAAKAYAFHLKHPDKPINLLGYSAGGMVTHETAQILKEMGVKNVRVANFGSPYWGLTDKVGDSITFASKNDPAISQGGVAVRDPIMTNSVVDHFSYLRDADVRRKLKNLFDGKPPKAETSVWVPNVTNEPKAASPSVKQSSGAAEAARERAQRIEEIARKKVEREKRKQQKAENKDAYAHISLV